MDARFTKGSKVVLRGVPEEQLAQVKQSLEAHHMRAVSSLAQADLVVLGPQARDWVRKSAERKGMEVVELQAFLATLELVAAGADAPLQELPLRPAVELQADKVRILDVELPRRFLPGRLTPPSDQFRHFSLDGPTLRTARTVALAAKHGIPCLLEGETATAKTSVILWVASLVNAQVVRLNLNGQTDTSELVGRYVPSEGLPEVDVQAFQRHMDLLEEESRRIITRATEERRPLSKVERQQVAANEQLPVPTWRFQEGFVPLALRLGYWVVLDEVNLAEPQVLERLNPVLERPPSLVLTEGDGTRIGAKGDVPVHPEFRMFATMNPAEYAGRTALSPAYRDRWQISRFVDPPSEADLHAMLRRLVFGEQPQVPYEGALYQAEQAPPIHGDLRQVPDIDQLLERLAVFHASVCAAAGQGSDQASIGRTRRERYVFSRRTLLTALGLVAVHSLELPGDQQLDVHRAPARIVTDVLERLYLDRLQDGADREAVHQALRAAGLDA